MIICELVLNAAKHSDASLINVEINTTVEMVSISITDNGKGFNYSTGHKNNTFGLQSASSRVAYLKGNFLLSSEKNKGTAININIPLQFNEAHVNSL
ncbi:MAG: histidine kinase [Segetibacter sp.]|nr:histidine kinase [Segetibacter sp.]